MSRQNHVQRPVLDTCSGPNVDVDPGHACIQTSQGASAQGDLCTISGIKITTGHATKKTSGCGSIPINTIFSGMNIHLPAILGFTRYQGFDPSPSGCGSSGHIRPKRHAFDLLQGDERQQIPPHNMTRSWSQFLG